MRETTITTGEAVAAFAALGEVLREAAAGIGTGSDGSNGTGSDGSNGTGSGTTGSRTGSGNSSGTGSGTTGSGSSSGTGSSGSSSGTGSSHTPSLLAAHLSQLASAVHHSNPWFTPGNVRLALSATGSILTAEKLTHWLSAYPLEGQRRKPATVGVVMAGNIPLVGFHDMLCVLITGNRLQARLSSRDELLMRAVAETLTTIEPRFESMIEITTGRLGRFDTVIATGSNNTSRYFEYYFRNVPSIIRHNRNSIAIIDGTESDRELELLGDDIFTYFGLGCRNVSKIWLPEGYDPASLPPHWQHQSSLRSHYKYDVNYTHQTAVMAVNRERFTDGGFVLLKESSSLTPPMSVVSYEYYPPGHHQPWNDEIAGERVQCVAGHGHLPFGSTQRPELWDYADNVDTIAFLLKKTWGQ